MPLLLARLLVEPLLLPILVPAGRLGCLKQLLLRLGDVRRPVRVVVVSERLDVAGLVLLGERLELVEDALRQRLVLLGQLAVVGRLVHPEPANPDLQLRILFELAEHTEVVDAGLDLARQRLELAAGEVHLRVPEQAILGGEVLGELGLEPIDLAAELEIVLHRGAQARRVSSDS